MGENEIWIGNALEIGNETTLPTIHFHFEGQAKHHFQIRNNIQITPVSSTQYSLVSHQSDLAFVVTAATGNKAEFHNASHKEIFHF